MMAAVLGPLPPLRDVGGVPGSRLEPGPALVVAGLWGANQRWEGCACVHARKRETDSAFQVDAKATFV